MKVVGMLAKYYEYIFTIFIAKNMNISNITELYWRELRQ